MAFDSVPNVRGEVLIHHGGGVFGHEREHLRDPAPRRVDPTQDRDGTVVVFDDDVGSLTSR
jgi:hypothetical protein